MGAFSVFFTQSPSFLAYQRDMKLRKGRSNAESLFALREIPSDNQIRNLLDPINPQYLERCYRQIFQGLEQSGILKGYRSFANTLLVAIDGTKYFSSQKIHCEQCNQRTLSNGKVIYYHSVVTPVIVQPGNEHVISLEPEFITPQDGTEKAKQLMTILGDDLYSRQSFCQELKDKNFHFILVCKPDSHINLSETIDFLGAQGVLGHKEVQKWNGHYTEIYTYRYANQLLLRGAQYALEVNWCELSITREDSGELIFKNAYITDFEVTDLTVEDIVCAGRLRMSTIMYSRLKAITLSTTSDMGNSIWLPYCCP